MAYSFSSICPKILEIVLKRFLVIYNLSLVICLLPFLQNSIVFFFWYLMISADGVPIENDKPDDVRVRIALLLLFKEKVY